MLATLLKWTKKNKGWLFALSIMVVFCTTYLLILPALTLDEQEAERQGGIDVTTEEQDVDAVEAPKDQSADENVDDQDTDSLTADAADELSFEGDGFNVTAACDAKAGLPSQTELAVTPIDENDEDYEAYCDEALKAVQDEEGGESTKELKFAYFYDISLMADGESVEPDAPVDVAISYEKALHVSDAENLRIVHFGVDKKGEPKTEVLNPEDVTLDLQEKEMSGAAFAAESFSVYAVVYTVDFHWDVNGKEYDFSIPGGGFISLTELLDALDVVEDDSETFITEVEKVEFSDPDLVWVGQTDSETTVGALKEANGLDCQYSNELTEKEIEEINAQTVEAGDWALISLKAFDTEETLTITMKNGDQFVVKVTDAQDPSIYVGKEVIIYDNGEQRAMLSNGYTYDGRYRLNSIPLSEADGNDAAHWTVEQHNNNYYLKSSDNRYLTINGNDVGLVNDWSVATPLQIRAGTNPDYRISAANNNNNVLSYSTNNDWGDGYFSAPGGKNGSPNQEWLYISVVETVPDRAGDWLLYFDDDFSEITIHVGETISLRPYNKWDWKEGNVNVQTAHWNIGGRNNNYWNQIDINDDNGAHKESWDDGVFHWTAYVKKDDQLDTHYWAVQGQATQTGDYILTNTKNGETITVHVVDGNPVNKPNTVNKIANIKVNLFDYDNGGELDVGWVNGESNHNLANDNNFKNESVNQMGGSNHFYFLSSGSGSNNKL